MECPESHGFMNRKLGVKIRKETWIREPSEQGHLLRLGKNIKSWRECKVRIKGLRNKSWIKDIGV